MKNLKPNEWVFVHMEAWRVALGRQSEELALDAIKGVTSDQSAIELFWRELTQHKTRIFNLMESKAA